MSDDPLDPAAGEAVAASLGLEPLPGEGGLVRKTYDDGALSCALYVLVSPDFSALHVLDAVEVYHWLGGAALSLLLLEPGGEVARVRLGPAPNHTPQVVVPSGVWQGSRSDGAWSLVGLSVVPAFTPERFRLGDRAQLQAGWPEATADISALTRADTAQE